MCVCVCVCVCVCLCVSTQVLANCSFANKDLRAVKSEFILRVFLTIFLVLAFMGKSEMGSGRHFMVTDHLEGKS